MVTSLIIMPVKDSLQTAGEAIRSVVASGHSLTVYDDFSTKENAAALDRLSEKLGIQVIHLNEHTDHPSPNYRWVLQHAQNECLATGKHLVIIESDVTIRQDTIERLCADATEKVGMVAAVTTDKEGRINFPYEYAKCIPTDGACTKRLSFCCTLLTNELLRAYNFALLDPSKNWYDVHISHMSRKLGFENILQISNPVIHAPHSSRPWKQLKYTNPLLYYWNKLIHGKDKI